VNSPLLPGRLSATLVLHEEEQSEKKSSRKTDWAAEVRKHKPRLNALSDAERDRLLEKGMAMIYGVKPAEADARGR